MSDNKIIFRRLRLEAYRGDKRIMYFLSPDETEVLQLADKMIHTNTSGPLEVKLYEETMSERLVSVETHGIVPVLVEDDPFADIGL